MTPVIQAIYVRAPEVMIGAPWDTTTDLWNLGPVLLEIHLAQQMFIGQRTQNEDYDAKLHLYEMADFFGPFPKKELLAKADQEIVQEVFDDECKVKGFDLTRLPLESEA